ncbi:LysR family transcriptional regulator [Catenovulum maritimum]|uniref:LysR family transcriptional regulator n=1 Tax=Catenovulum maritimum TaxID=1513271 RepID=A0A0J8GQD6_9ALTE|nr:LysR family transcriptional regulator [Catenovulum maritimum]KMT64985.1 LysR family transcriptional regulator [Catenovulum maritimum]
MDTIDGLKTVIAVVETGSFTAASERLAISKALVSKYIGEIEDKLDIRLFNRTTRKISLTEAGSNYYQHAVQLVEKYDAMVDDVVGEQASPKGLLRVSAPVTFGERWLASHIPEFSQMYPDLNLELVLNNRPVDMLEEGIDVRIKIGTVEDSNMIARHINDVAVLMCASPKYLKQHGVPVKPEDLHQHQCIIDTNFRVGRFWPLTSEQGHQVTIEVVSKLACNSPQAIANIAKAGGGIAFITHHAIADELNSGELIQVLPEYKSLTFGIYAMYPHRKHVSRKVKCFVEFMQQKFG